MKKADLVVVALYTFVVLAGKLAEAAGAGVTVTLITGMSFILAAGGAASWVCRRYPKIAEKIEDAIAASLGHKVLTAGLFGAVAVVDRVSRLHRDTFPPHLAMCGMVGRNIAVPQQAAGRQGGASVANRQKSGTKSSGDDDGDGDPDPDDQIIHDPYSQINNHPKTTPQNRISRKAILAHRGGIYKTHPYAYNWYVSRALREIERAIVDTISDSGRSDLSLDSREEAPEGAWILFQRLCKNHDLNLRPNPVFFGKKGLVYESFVRSPSQLHDEITRDWRNSGQREHRKKSAEIGIVKQNKKEFAADIYSVANGLAAIDDSAKIERKWWREEEDCDHAKEYQGVKIKHLPPQPIRARSYHFATMVSLESNGGDGDGSDRLEREAIDALVYYGSEADNADTIDADAEEESLRAGNIARKLVLHVQRAPDPEAAAEAVAEALNMQPDSLLNTVIVYLQKDFANAEAANVILRKAGFAAMVRPEPQKQGSQPRSTNFNVDKALYELAKLGEKALKDCPEYYFTKLHEQGGYANLSNLKSVLVVRERNKLRHFSPEIKKVAAILLEGYKILKNNKGVRV